MWLWWQKNYRTFLKRVLLACLRSPRPCWTLMSWAGVRRILAVYIRSVIYLTRRRIMRVRRNARGNWKNCKIRYITQPVGYVCTIKIWNIWAPPKIEAPRDKTNNVAVCPAKTQISLGIRPVGSESSLTAWRKLRSLAERTAKTVQTGQISRLIWVFAGGTVILLVLRRLNCCNYPKIKIWPLNVVDTIEMCVRDTDGMNLMRLLLDRVTVWSRSSLFSRPVCTVKKVRIITVSYIQD